MHKRLSPQMLQALSVAAPGTPLRDGLDRIILAHTGALVVVGESTEVQGLCTGGFSVNIEFSAQRLAELAKMDGAIILSDDSLRIARANVHLVPNREATTTETGTRHRTAERVARTVNAPVIAVSEEMSVITVYSAGEKEQLLQPVELMFRANQALQTMERYRNRLIEVRQRLMLLEHNSHATLRDAALLVQRAEMVDRIADEVSDYVVELGLDGRMVRMQLEELLDGIGDERQSTLLAYGDFGTGWTLDAAIEELRSMDDAELFDLASLATLFHQDGSLNLDEIRQPNS